MSYTHSLRVFATVCLLAHGYASPLPVNTRLELRGQIQTAGNRNGFEAPYSISFGGKLLTSDKEGFFTIPIEDEPKQLFVLICPSKTLLAPRQHNTVQSLQLDRSGSFLLFAQQPDGSWHEQKIPAGTAPYQLDDEHTVIVRLNPKYVQSVCTWKLNMPQHVIKLPLITLRAETKISQSPKSLLNSLSSFFERVPTKKKQEADKPHVKSFLVP